MPGRFHQGFDMMLRTPRLVDRLDIRRQVPRRTDSVQRVAEPYRHRRCEILSRPMAKDFRLLGYAP